MTDYLKTPAGDVKKSPVSRQHPDAIWLSLNVDETVVRAQMGGRAYGAPSGVVHVIVGSAFEADALSARWAHLRYERKKRAGGSAWQMVKFLRDA